MKHETVFTGILKVKAWNRVKKITVCCVWWLCIFGCDEDKDAGFLGGVNPSGGESPFSSEGGFSPTPPNPGGTDILASEDVDGGEGDSVSGDDVGVIPGPTYCDDGIPCIIDSVLKEDGSCSGGKFICGDCAGSGCETDSDCVHFNDDNVCNGVLHCGGGHCKVDVDSVVSCSEFQAVGPNTRVRCNASSGQCQEELLPDGQTCDDGQGCTLDDLMIEGVCIGTEVCVPCDNLGDGQACDDGDPCTEATSCVAGRCIGNDVCECASNADCVPLEDGNACNGRLLCVAGTCEINPDSLVDCQRACPNNSCYQGSCLEDFGFCVGSPKSDCEPESF